MSRGRPRKAVVQERNLKSLEAVAEELNALYWIARKGLIKSVELTRLVACLQALGSVIREGKLDQAANESLDNLCALIQQERDDRQRQTSQTTVETHAAPPGCPSEASECPRIASS